MRFVHAFVAALIVLAMAACNNDDNCVNVECTPYAKRFSLGVIREIWSIASPPFDQSGTSTLATRGLHDRAFNWFNPYVQFQDSDLYDTDAAGHEDGSRRIRVLVLEFRPYQSTTKGSAVENSDAWGGIMRGFPIAMWDQSRVDFLELRLAVATHGMSSGLLHIDLGRISEDVNQDNSLNTEDRPMAPGLPPNRLLDEGEDTGLDGLANEFEISPNGEPYDPVTNFDPVGDDWSYDSDLETRYEYGRINGTEQSLQDPVRGLRPDTEDLGGESEFDLLNAYYEWTIDLDDPESPYLVSASAKSSGDVTGFAETLTWQTYRIPAWQLGNFAQFADSGLQHSPAQVLFGRIWISSSDSTVRVFLGAIDIVDLPEQ